MAEPTRTLMLTQTHGLPLAPDPLSGSPELRISARDLYAFLESRPPTTTGLPRR